MVVLDECHSLGSCMNVLFDKLMDLCYETLFPMHDVVVCTLLAI